MPSLVEVFNRDVVLSYLRPNPVAVSPLVQSGAFVSDTGAFRASHRVSINQTDQSFNEAEKDKGGGSTISKGTSALSRLVPYSTVYIQTNAPYATAIEFGQYPNPVKKGSYDKKAKKYVIKSVGGFSQQAPQGVYSTTFNYIAQKYGG